VLTRRRLLVGLLAIVVVAVVYTGWQTSRVHGELTQAEDAAQRLRASIGSGDKAERSSALGDLRLAAAAAHDHSDGPWWSLLSHLPLVGDDVTGIRALSSSLDAVATEGIQPLADAVDGLDGISTDGKVDLQTVASLQDPVERSAEAFRAADADVSTLDSSGYAGFLKMRFDDYVDDIARLERGVRMAANATAVLPDVLGAAGPRNYLLVFQNNAEIRATGGLPGAWALVHAEDGRLTIEQQGTGSGDFPRLDEPVIALTPEEDAVYSDLMGTFFLDANFTPDYPRAAELWRARWERDYAPTTVDGVLSLDPVSLSYLLRGTGPVEVGDVTLTADNAIQELLNEPYLTLDNTAQDAFFATAAKNIFDALTGDAVTPVEVVKALAQAAQEGRFLMASYDDAVEPALADSPVQGALAADDGTDPHVQIGLVDATGSKMSYYMRYRARVSSQSCADGVQSLLGSMTLDQSISAAAASQLPVSVTGPGTFGTSRGLQTVVVRIYSPTGGSLGPIRIDGATIDYEPEPLNGRQVATILTQLDGPDDVVVNWTMTTGAGQTGDGSTGVTPGVTGGSKASSFASSC
jgi:hypothetical protein